MRLGLSTLVFPWWTLERAVERCLDLGSEHVEIICDLPYFIPGRSGPDLRRVRDLLRSHGASVSVHAGFWDLNPGSCLPELRRLTLKRLKLGIETCARLGGEIVVLHAPRCHIPELRWLWEKTRRLYDRTLRECLKLAGRLGITLALENGSSAFGPYAALRELAALLRGYDPSELGACFDVGHAYLEACRRGARDPSAYVARWLRRLGRRTLSIHVHDNRGEHDEHLAPGEGDIDFAEIARAVGELGYRGLLVVELFDPRSPLRTAKVGLRRSRELFRRRV
jgi:sugar phosphate isomerase/epimerase